MKTPAAKPDKLDLKRELHPLYAGKPNVVTEVTPGTRGFLCSRGVGDPNTSPQYKAAVEALFSVAYTLKFTVRKQNGPDYAVMPLEGLWWADDPDVFRRGDRSQWQWTMMILQPDFITNASVAEAKTAAAKKRGIDVSLVSFEEYSEGPCAQTLHVGPCSAGLLSAGQPSPASTTRSISATSDARRRNAGKRCFANHSGEHVGRTVIFLTQRL